MKKIIFEGKEYDKHRLRYSSPAIKYIKTMINLTPSNIVLDLACGTGILLLEFSNDVEKVIGLDASWSMLNFLQKQNNSDKKVVILGDGNLMPFKQKTFDVITLGHAIHWFDLDLLLPEICRLLKPGGWFVTISRYPSPSAPYRPLCHYILDKKRNKGKKSAQLTELKDVGCGHIVGIENYGFCNYSRIVIESEDIIPVKVYAERVSDNDFFMDLLEKEKIELLRELEAALLKISDDGIIHEMNFDYIITAQRKS